MSLSCFSFNLLVQSWQRPSTEPHASCFSLHCRYSWSGLTDFGKNSTYFSFLALVKKEPALRGKTTVVSIVERKAVSAGRDTWALSLTSSGILVSGFMTNNVHKQTEMKAANIKSQHEVSVIMTLLWFITLWHDKGKQSTKISEGKIAWVMVAVLLGPQLHLRPHIWFVWTVNYTKFQFLCVTHKRYLNTHEYTESVLDMILSGIDHRWHAFAET